jgi:RNAse (barnase) inhibitor barstar
MRNIIVISASCTPTIAVNLVKNLIIMGYTAYYKYNLSKEECADENNETLYIIMYYNESHGLVPKKYILYQIEQSTSTHIFNLIKLIDKSIFVWDFSIKNYSVYDKMVPLSKFFYMPFTFCADNTKINKENKYDILFYGLLNERRIMILTLLAQKYRVYTAQGVYGMDLDNLISESRMVINIHYYKDPALETARINEILQHNKLVISELAHLDDEFNMSRYNDTIIYFDEINEKYDNMQQLYNVVDYYLNDDNYNRVIDKIKVNTPLLEKQSLFYLQKNMLVFEKYCVNNVKKINKNKIINVTYGEKNNNVLDITKKFIDYASNNEIMSKTFNMNAYVGDPCAGVTKMLTITLNTGKIISIDEHDSKFNHDILFCEGSVSDVTAKNINKNKIINVTYGKINNNALDVTKKFIDYASNNEIMSKTFNMNAYVGDPCVNVAKILTITLNTGEIILINEINCGFNCDILFCEYLLNGVCDTLINPIHDVNENDIYCLHLVETPDRMKIFRRQKYQPIVKIYTGIKCDPPYIGCGLSYKNMIWNAKRCNIDTITICEDDCAFKSDFEDKYKIIKSFLKQYESGWDIFVGCIASLPEDTEVKNVIKYNGMTFIEINKMHSTVFNIYNKSCYDVIYNWNDKDICPHNQIDQYIKKQNFKIITTVPFEFECLDSKSTIWDCDLFNRYNCMFDESKKTIDLLLQKFYSNKQ